MACINENVGVAMDRNGPKTRIPVQSLSELDVGWIRRQYP